MKNFDTVIDVIEDVLKTNRDEYFESELGSYRAGQLSGRCEALEYVLCLLEGLKND